MLTVIFGAGASFDSDPANSSLTSRDPFRPPLARDLFDPNRFGDISRRYPQALALFPELR